MKSIFTERGHRPTEIDLEKALGDNYNLWVNLRKYTLDKAPHASQEWKFTGEKFGWSFRISDKKRVILYLLPRDGFFRVGLVFGQKATDAVLASGVSTTIKDELTSARAYAEGRGIRLEVRGGWPLHDIETLISIKLSY